MKKILLSIWVFILSGCLGMPENMRPVQDFDLQKYIGKWYEIARLDHSFERGLTQVTAEYQQRKDGGISVVNRGYSARKGQWKEANGKAFFINDNTEAYLKVSFFGPFYGSYVVFELDQKNYEYAFVSGPDTSYLWLLSRKPKVSAEVKQKFIDLSRSLGFNTDELIWVEQNQASL